MRSREEQIDAMTDDLDMFHANNPGGGMRGYERHASAQEIAAKHIDEAERRAEQRVRAEIARDSERLDWLAVQIVRVRAHAPYQPIILNGTYDPGEFRDAIDAEREAQG